MIDSFVDFTIAKNKIYIVIFNIALNYLILTLNPSGWKASTVKCSPKNASTDIQYVVVKSSKN